MCVQPKAGALLTHVTVTTRASSANEQFAAPPHHGALTALLMWGTPRAAPHVTGQRAWHPSITQPQPWAPTLPCAEGACPTIRLSVHPFIHPSLHPSLHPSCW